MSVNFENLILKAIESDSEKELDDILNLLENEKVTHPIKESISLLIDNWQETPEKQPNTTHFIIELSRFFRGNDFPELRTAIAFAIKRLLPANINKTAAIKVLGVKNKEISLSKVYTRYNYLSKLQSGQIFHNNLSKTWGIVGEIDWRIGTIALFNFNGTFLQDIELESFFDNSCLFKNIEEIKQLQKIKIEPEKNEITAILKENSVATLDDNKLKNILLQD